MFKEIIARTREKQEHNTIAEILLLFCENIVPVDWVLCLQQGL